MHPPLCGSSSHPLILAMQATADCILTFGRDIINRIPWGHQTVPKRLNTRLSQAAYIGNSERPEAEPPVLAPQIVCHPKGILIPVLGPPPFRSWGVEPHIDAASCPGGAASALHILTNLTRSLRGLPGPAPCPRAGHHPPRRQAGQHLAHGRRPCQAGRLRAGGGGPRGQPRGFARGTLA